jgi:outer membrane protein
VRFLGTAAVAAFALLPISAGAESLSDLYQLAKQNDLTLQVAASQRDAALENKPQARSAVLPQLTAQADARSNQFNVKSVNAESSYSETNERYTTTGYSLTLSQVLFDWSAFETLSQADKLVAQGEAAYVSAEQDLIVRLVTAYFDVLSAEDTLRADQGAQEAFKQQLAQLEEKFRSGLTPITDVKNAQAAYDGSTAEVIADTTALNNAKRALGIIVGRPVGQIARLRDEIALAPPTPSSVDNWVQAAKSDNPDVLSARYAAEAARDKISATRAQHFPTVSAVGSISQDDSGSRFGYDATSNYIGVNLTLPIFQGGLVSSSVRTAEASYMEGLAKYQLALRVADQSVRDNYEGVVSGIARVNASSSAVTSQQNSVVATEVGFKVGIRTVIDVLNVRQALANSQKNFAQSRYDYLISLLSLKSSVGQLTKQDIDDIDRLTIPSNYGGIPPR